MNSIKYTRYKKEHKCIDCAETFIAKAPAAKRCVECRSKHVPGELKDRTIESLNNEIERLEEQISNWKNKRDILRLEVLRRSP